MDDLVATVLQESLLAGMFAAVLWWMTTRQEKLLTMLCRRIEVTNLLMIGLQKELLVHDLTVSGINPSTGANHDERTQNVLQKYEELLRVFSSMEAHIKEQRPDG